MYAKEANREIEQVQTYDISQYYAKATPLEVANTKMWACLDSNQGPHPYQGCALTN